MTSNSILSDLPLFKGRNFETAEFESLLDLLPNAYFVIRRNGRILFSNSKLVELSAYTRKELSELELSTLFPNLTITDLLSESLPKITDALLISRRSQEIDVQLEIRALNGDEGWLVISLRRTSELERDDHKRIRNEGRWEAIHILSLAAQQNDLPSTYRQILQAGELLISAKHLALYIRGKQNTLELISLQGSGLNFPATIEETDIAHLREPKLWERGKGINSPLQQIAHENKLRFLATIPLDIINPSQGILVAADSSTSPPEDITTLMQILAASISSAEINMKLLNQMQLQIDTLAMNNQLSNKLESGVHDGIIYLDTDLNVQGINRAAEIMLGYSANEAIGRSVNNILISSHPLLNKLVQAQSGKAIEDIGDVKLHRRDGSDLLANLRIEIIEEDGQVTRIVIFLSDLSENEALHIQSQQLQQRAWLGEVTAIFAHEVRNPINNISTGLQLMQISFDEDDPLQEQIKALQEDCDRLEHRMKSVLSFSRSMDHNPEVLNLGEFCQMQLDRWKAKMARNQIEPHLTLGNEACFIMGDRQALDQVFTNLINNSIQAFDEGDNGIIAIKIKMEHNENGSDNVILHFSDNGPGIPDDLAIRVFEPFFTTKDGGGTGLGLAITKRIIQAHKGEIELESFPGGTMFKIRLPAAPSAEGQLD